MREGVPALGRRPHYLRHFDEGPAGVASGPIKRVVFVKCDVTFSRELNILPENAPISR